MSFILNGKRYKDGKIYETSIEYEMKKIDGEMEQVPIKEISVAEIGTNIKEVDLIEKIKDLESRINELETSKLEAK